ncbi:MAG: hypothetical protein KDD48_00020 [Bdellovibrionales bacterium]|nr:hypothetical protein [Bdellovibrionales bacterium]
MTTVSRETLQISHFFDLSAVWFSDFLGSVNYPWELLAAKYKETWITENLRSNIQGVPREGSLVLKTTEIKTSEGNALVEAGSYLVGDNIELRSGVRIEAGAYIAGPTILGAGTEVRHGAYVRGGVLTGKNCVIGHASEVKSSIFLDAAKASHFAYVGDSILGNFVNLGAGTKVSNLKMTQDDIVLRLGNDLIKTGLRKMGAIIGDRVETGCNSVLNPGVLLASHCMVYPAIGVKKNYYAHKTIIKTGF